jgi:peptidoglycan/LPS O-acetylase OafA/YrhL
MTAAPARPAPRPAGPPAAPQRFAFLDALRGVAALWVAGYHLYGGLAQHGRRPLGEAAHALLSHGNAGVEIFFVLSGFVMAYSLGRSRVTPRFAGLFLLRRSLRLDPPYWATIALSLVVAAIAARSRSQPLPALDWPKLAAHLFYLQDVLHRGQFVEVFWTLCMEIQFYLVLVLLLALWQGLGCGRGALAALFLPLTLLSLAVQFGGLHSPNPGLALKFWYLFQLGLLTCWALDGTIPGRWLLGYAAVVVGLLLGVSFTVECLVGVLTGLALFAVGRLGGLRTWLGGRVPQYLGRVSYSLYLTHAVVGTPFAYSLARKLAGPEPGPLATLGLLALALGVSLAAADLFYRFIERPSTRLSQRLKARPTPPPTGRVTGGTVSLPRWAPVSSR